MNSVLQKSVNVLPWQIRRQIRRIPGVAALQRWVVRRYLGGMFDHRVNAGPAAGVVFPITLPDDKQIWTGTYEAVLATAVQAAVRPGAVCMDVGAYRGFFGALMARAGASAVYMFEPNPRNQARLRRLGELNPDLPLHFFDIALGAQPGTAEFRVLTDNTMGKLADSRFETAAVAVDEARTVTLETIDHLVESGRIRPPDVIKLDVEGAEEDVLAGAEGLLAAHPPVWFIEAHTPELARACNERLTRYGYRVTLLGSNQPVAGAVLPPVSHLVARPPSA